MHTYKKKRDGRTFLDETWWYVYIYIQSIDSSRCVQYAVFSFFSFFFSPNTMCTATVFGFIFACPSILYILYIIYNIIENLCGVSDCASFPIVPTPTDKKATLEDHEEKEDEATKSIIDENTVQKLPASDTIDVDNDTKVTVPSVASSTMEQMVYLRQKKE